LDSDGPRGIRRERSRGRTRALPRNSQPGSLEAELSSIGKSAPVREWAKIPADYFVNLDSYLQPTTKKK
jgi:hypothetical protein